MVRFLTTAAVAGLLAATLFSWQGGDALADVAEPPPSRFSDDGFYTQAAGLTPSEQAGREIWYKSTAGNARFHTYTYQQRLHIFIDWYRVLRSDRRDDRFKVWGLMNNPGCCEPGSDGCPAKSYEETYGFDWCPGDEDLLAHVGREGYRDPACDMQYGDAASAFGNGPLAGHKEHDPSLRQSSCDLAFGTSTGAMGLRKFPNPRFDEEAWRKLNGGKLGTWDGFSAKMQEKDATGYDVRRLADGSVEPPFMIGMSCGACHIAFDPLNPPADPAHPEWENLLGAIGNQYTRMSEIMASGMPEDSVEWQVFTHTRPGTVDTSAVPNDQVNNPGTMNAIINTTERLATHRHDIIKWRATDNCPVDADVEQCWCDPAHEGKCWEKGRRTEPVHNILKGGGDSIGAREAVQRVYVNIGSCAEACWLNHLTDLRELDPAQRNWGQTPFDIGQCRRDCPNFRAVEDRLGNIVDFLLSSKASSTPLHAAMGLDDVDALIDQLDDEYGDGTVARGRQVFADNCARCHSSRANTPEAFAAKDVYEMNELTGVRDDWLGNDVPSLASEVGSYRCRALHSNHMEGHVWQEYASETYRARPADPNLPDPTGGGRGYYRNISLVDLWAHAPFMHNNAIGPELCGDPDMPKYVEDAPGDLRQVNFYASPYVSFDDLDGDGEFDDATESYAPLGKDEAPSCWAYDPSVDGRVELFRRSVELLLNPDQRVPKVTMVSTPVRLDVGPKMPDGKDPRRLLNVRIEIPTGTSAGYFGSFQHKNLARDLWLAHTDPETLKQRLRLGPRPDSVDADVDVLKGLANTILDEVKSGRYYALGQRHGEMLMALYATCRATVENAGHEFGEDLSPDDKKALTAFLTTI